MNKQASTHRQQMSMEGEDEAVGEAVGSNFSPNSRNQVNSATAEHANVTFRTDEISTIPEHGQS